MAVNLQRLISQNFSKGKTNPIIDSDANIEQDWQKQLHGLAKKFIDHPSSDATEDKLAVLFNSLLAHGTVEQKSEAKNIAHLIRVNGDFPADKAKVRKLGDLWNDGKTHYFDHISFSNNGNKAIVSTTGWSQIRDLDTKTGISSKILSDHYYKQPGIGYDKKHITADGKKAVCVDWKEFMVYDLKTEELLLHKEFDGVSQHFRTEISALSKDGKTLAVAGSDGILRCYSTEDGQQNHIEVEFDVRCKELSYSPNGEYLVAMPMDGSVVVINTKAKKPFVSHTTMTFEEEHNRDLKDYRFSGDGKMLVISYYNDEVLVIDLEKGHPHFQQKFEQIVDFGGNAALSKTGHRVFVAGQKDLRVYSTRTGEAVAELKGHKSPTNLVAVSDDGQMVATADAKGRVILWDAQSLKLIGGFDTERKGELQSMEFSPNNKRLVVADLSWGATYAIT